MYLFNLWNIVLAGGLALGLMSAGLAITKHFGLPLGTYSTAGFMAACLLLFNRMYKMLSARRIAPRPRAGGDQGPFRVKSVAFGLIAFIVFEGIAGSAVGIGGRFTGEDVTSALLLHGLLKVIVSAAVGLCIGYWSRGQPVYEAVSTGSIYSFLDGVTMTWVLSRTRPILDPVGSIVLSLLVSVVAVAVFTGVGGWAGKELRGRRQMLGQAPGPGRGEEESAPTMKQKRKKREVPEK